MGVFDLSSTSRAVRSCSRCVCVGVVGHLHGPALLFGGACFRDPGLASVCVCVFINSLSLSRRKESMKTVLENENKENENANLLC